MFSSTYSSFLWWFCFAGLAADSGQDSVVEGACIYVYICVVDCGVLYQEKTEWEDRFTREENDVLCCTRKLLIWVYSLQVRVFGKPYSQENV